ncbi:MAG: lipopolysaccharide heptosyltransferase II [Candidatus Omnitrophota bacterium]
MTNKILFITLSNIGDVILTLPGLDYLRQHFPEAKVTVLTGLRPKRLFENNPNIEKVVVYNKHARLRDKIRLFEELKKENSDIVVDLRNSLFGVLLPARYRNSPFIRIPKHLGHMRDRHLYKIYNLGFEFNPARIKKQEDFFDIDSEDKEHIDNILKENNISGSDNLVVIASGARSHSKRWPKEKFKRLIDSLTADRSFKIILVGDKEDAGMNEYIASNVKDPVLDLSAKTTLLQLSYLLKKAKFVVTNDSAVLHLASYLNRPVVAIFGPTDEKKYGPWSKNCIVVKKELFCRPCEKAQCRFKTLECIKLIQVEDVLKAVGSILDNENQESRVKNQEKYKRILITRTDRIGDVLLSTPVIKAVRDRYPDAFIAMIVRPYSRDIVADNPYLDQVIIYDKSGKEKSWCGSYRFARKLSKKKFDLAIILHPTNRMHLISFLAGIPRRVGYNRKLGVLLTDGIKHTKQFGEKHELEYSLDLLKVLNIEPKERNLFMPLKGESEIWADELLEKEGIKKSHRLLVINPGASCPSKIWPGQRFAELANRLIEKYGFRIIVISGPKEITLVEKMVKGIDHPVVNLAGRTSVNQLASIVRRCELLISNDSGPVHIATAVGVPVISIFGRNQQGLSPRRWGPLGKRDRILHKEVGCVECLAHDCVKEFICLKAIEVEDVMKAVECILSER